MVLTRQQSEAVWVRLCDNVLGAQAGTPMRLSFEHNGGVIESLIDFETATPQVFDNLVFMNAAVPPVQRQLNPGMKNRLILFQQFLQQLRIDNNGVDLDVADWEAITEDQFDTFRDTRRIQANVPVANPVIPGIPPPAPIPVPQPAAPPDLVCEFKKSIKRDDSAYPIFKEQKNRNSWNQKNDRACTSPRPSGCFGPWFCSRSYSSLCSQTF